RVLAHVQTREGDDLRAVGLDDAAGDRSVREADDRAAPAQDPERRAGRDDAEALAPQRVGHVVLDDEPVNGALIGADGADRMPRRPGVVQRRRRLALLRLLVVPGRFWRLSR